MNRKKFAHSWGRKLFFGLSWPLSLALGLIYLKSFILPVTITDFVYFIVTYIGHFGLLNALVYFFLFAPVTSMMPSYYVSRFWSLVLILGLNLFILIDGLCFSIYHLHLYSFLYKFFATEGIVSVVKNDLGEIIIYVGIAMAALVIWIRGELHWRTMQGRFSNPIKNWYVVLIALFIVGSKLIYFYGDVDPKLASIFPFDYNYPEKASSFNANQRIYYPKQALGCQTKTNPSVVLFVVKNLTVKNFNETDMPHLFQMQKHSVSYTSHMNPSSNVEGSLFSLLYSIPASYAPIASHIRPALMNVLEDKKYEIIKIENDMASFQNWIKNHSNDDRKPFFLTVLLDQSNADGIIQEMVLELQSEDFLEGTHLIFTSASSENGRIPFFYALPSRTKSAVDTLTTHYDVMPTLMKNFWNCKNVFEAASVGAPLGSTGRDWYLSSDINGFKINDLKTESSIEVVDGRDKEIGNPRRGLIFQALESLNFFNHP